MYFDIFCQNCCLSCAVNSWIRTRSGFDESALIAFSTSELETGRLGQSQSLAKQSLKVIWVSNLSMHSFSLESTCFADSRLPTPNSIFWYCFFALRRIPCKRFWSSISCIRNDVTVSVVCYMIGWLQPLHRLSTLHDSADHEVDFVNMHRGEDNSCLLSVELIPLK